MLPANPGCYSLRAVRCAALQFRFMALLRIRDLVCRNFDFLVFSADRGHQSIAMAKIKLNCSKCGHCFEVSRSPSTEVNCPVCGGLTPVPPVKRRKVLYGLLGGGCLIFLTAAAWIVWPMGPRWPDRRPIGVLFLASTYFSSPTNPRGWFNDRSLNVTGPGGQERFRKALMAYANASLTNLLRLHAQGVIVWDLEGEQYPHKTSFIGDPRLLNRLAPEMAACADEFFKRFTNAGLRVGVTVRPQELVLDDKFPHQARQWDVYRILLKKVDYARAHWGASIFYIDSDEGFWRPDEVLQLRLLAQQRPGILLIPEHHYLPYWAFSAPYVSLHNGDRDVTAALARKVFPSSFAALNISDTTDEEIAAARHAGDILLFRAWYWNSDCQLLGKLEERGTNNN